MGRDIDYYIGNRVDKLNLIKLILLGILIFGSLWTISYYSSVGVAPHFDQTFFIGYIFVIAAIGTVAFLSFAFIFSCGCALFTEIFKDVEKEKRIQAAILLQIVIFGISAFFSTSFSHGIEYASFNHSVTVLLCILLYDRIIKIEQMKEFVDSIKRKDLPSIISLFLICFFSYTVLIYLLIGKSENILIALYSASFVFLIFELVCILGIVLYRKEVLNFIVFVILFILVAIVSVSFLNNANNNFEHILKLPFSTLKIGSVDALVIVDKQINLMGDRLFLENKLFNYEQDRIYKVHIISSIGSEYIVRRIGGDAKSPVIRIPKDKVKAVIYNYSDLKSYSINAKPYFQQ
ncbi:MAG: hypothetical protein AB7E48_04030 [Deferribacterales bacterium]